ncbi:hypothetical protein Poly51_59720 [Rubripirellula tenax]|uniref:Uncharacterized protein n=1 Tax=Rubripirellula tenax TaxID=2528015 RepID=A0A5C6E4V3_9BACT|nr:hypothetical protein [Rubripirellula tenax]TWU44703.1 hypothetical protein Poly51_59720 [Rubripirellula tenax]
MPGEIARVECFGGDVIADGTQWIDVTVNGVSLGCPIHVQPQLIDKAKCQVESIALEAYRRGYRAGANGVQMVVKDALGIR